jgi:benzoyl-CoA reductase/2-hydroxyglutaryl-CoA dehydratase subunit BcrC/BadD/HgdB
MTFDALHQDVEAAVRAYRATGGRVLAQIGVDVPVELIRAAGLLPYRLSADSGLAGSDDFPGQSPRSRALLARLAKDEDLFAGVGIAHGCVEDAQLFSVLRELARLGRGVGGAVAYVDALAGQGPETTRYNRARLYQFKAWLEVLTGKPITAEALAGEVRAGNAHRARLRRVLALRAESMPRLGGVQALDLLRAVSRLPIGAADKLLASVAEGAAPFAGRRVLVTGGAHETSALYAAIEAAGCVIVGEDHDWGEPWADRDIDEALDPFEALVARWRAPAPSAPTASSAARARWLADKAVKLGVEAVLHIRFPADESAPWDVRDTRRALDAVGVPFLTLTLDPWSVDQQVAPLHSRLAAFFENPSSGRPSARNARPAAIDGASPPRKPAPDSIGRRSHKALASTSDFATSQRQWFADVQRRAADGPFAVVNADAPQEILRAMDIPYVVNQWWASIVAAKQRGRDYAGLLKAADYPADVENYSAQGLAAALDFDTDSAPWGGLPKPDILAVVPASDAGSKIFEAWARETGAELFVFERSIDSRWDLPIAWWSDLPERWEQTLETERLDLMTAQLQASIPRLEVLTGRKFDPQRFVEVMRLVNEQEDYYRRTRDLIAATRPAPAGIADTMPATMVPQWHRGTVWGRDAAKRFYEEVAQRAADGEAACPSERVRLMWVGRGLWSDMGFYQRWEESHGAVFVWSMYLGLAADGYLRDFEGEEDAMRALAARFVTMGDELRMPTWAGAWHVKEAQLHGVDGAVAIDDADPFVLEALERAGVPVLRLAMSNMSTDAAALEAQVAAFIENLDRVGSA